ncbi:uncharacterized protein LOC122366132 isoform X2 [Amphibalanus amphitrite]|uniref:uncharacterized protein LOC122366132 isoform X2 n=2 Tax=Amphibalanus amphitrite TaxID=1232801 RepID=UPI001C91ADAE|nr:uncharacterized protein LOC122366132 isoform X2 [Amphibalanus amphitrite]
MNVMRVLRVTSRPKGRYHPGFRRINACQLSYLKLKSEFDFVGASKFKDFQVERHLCTHKVHSCQHSPYRPFSDNETDDSGSLLDEADEPDNVRLQLYPDSDDPVLRAMGRTTSVDNVFVVLGESTDPRHLCQAVVSLWDLHKLDEEPGSLPADDYTRLMDELLRQADSCDDLALVCALYSVVRLEGPDWQAAQARLEELCTARLPRLSLTALSRLGVCLQLHDSTRPWPPRLVQPYLRALAHYTATCASWHELRLLATALHSALSYVSVDGERRFMDLVRRFIAERDVGPDDVDSVFKLFKVLNSRGLRHWLALVCRDLASLYVRAEPRPPAAVTGQLGQAVLRFREASPAVERLLAERAVALLSQEPAELAQLRLLDTAAPSRIFPEWLRDSLLRTARDSLQGLEDRLDAPEPLADKASRIRLLTELQRARQLLSEVRPQRPAEHRRLWQLFLRTLHRPDAWIVSEQSVTRRHALAYFSHMAQLSPSCGLPELEAELGRRLELHCRAVVSTNRLVELASFLVAYGGRPVPSELLQRLLRLADNDQLSTHRVNRLSRAIHIGRSRVDRARTPQSTEHLHQLTQLTVALNNATVRLLPALTSTEAVVWLAGAALRRRGVVPGNTSVLGAALARFRALTEAPDGTGSELTSRAVDKLASCLEGARYADDAVMETLCRHVVEHRDHVTGVVAERVLSAAFRTGYWPADSGPFDDFLAAAADIVSRSLYRLTAESTLRACLSLCLYGQLPAQLARTVLGQAFLDKTERQIQHMVEQTGALQQAPAGGGPTAPAVRAAGAQSAATRLRRLQMEVNRAVRLNLPDQSVPWFTDVYAKGLPDPATGAAHRQLVAEVRDTLSALVGGADRVHCGVRAAGYQFTADLVVYRRPDGGFTDTDGPRVTSLALLVPSTHEYCTNRPQPTGGQLLRRRHLEMLGYTVRTVHPHHWNSMALAETADKLAFLGALIDGRNLLEERA